MNTRGGDSVKGVVDRMVETGLSRRVETGLKSRFGLLQIEIGLPKIEILCFSLENQYRPNEELIVEL